MRGPRTRRWIGLGLLAMFASAGPGVARAEDGLPSGRFGVGVGGRIGDDALGSTFGLGGVLTLEAGYQPTRRDRPFGWGVNWSIGTSWFGDGNQASIAGALRIFEFNLGMRARYLVAKRVLFAGAGGTLLRSNVPIPPDDARAYMGLYGSLGTELYVLGTYQIGLEGRYGLIGEGPTGLTLILSFSAGT